MTGTIGYDNHNIVPAAIPPGGAVVRPFEFQIRTLLDYDVTFMQDRIHSSIFVNGQPCGVYAAARVDEQPRDQWERTEVIRRYAPELERMVVDEFMGLGYRRQVQDLQREIDALKAHINRVRWWQLRRRWAARKAAA